MLSNAAEQFRRVDAMSGVVSRGADPSRILFDFDEQGHAKPLDPTIFTKKFDVQVVSDSPIGQYCEWLQLASSEYELVESPELKLDVEAWATSWSPQSKVSHKTMLVLESDVQLDMKRCKAKDFAAYNKSIGQNLLSKFVAKTNDQLRLISSKSTGNGGSTFSIFDVSLQQPELINAAGHTSYKVTITLRRNADAAAAQASPARQSPAAASSSRIRGLRDAVNHDNLLRKVSQDLDKLSSPTASGSRSPASKSPRHRASGESPAIENGARLYPSLENLAGFDLQSVKTCADGMQSISALRFTAFGTSARVTQVCAGYYCFCRKQCQWLPCDSRRGISAVCGLRLSVALTLMRH